jgi:hypothetical protein
MGLPKEGEKMKKLNKIINWIVFQVMGLCDLIGGYCLYLLMACEDDLQCSSRTFIQSTRLNSVLHQTSLRILTIVVTSNPVPKYIKNNLNVDGKDTFWELNYRRALCFLQAAFNIAYFFHHFCTLGFKSC